MAAFKVSQACSALKAPDALPSAASAAQASQHPQYNKGLVLLFLAEQSAESNHLIHSNQLNLDKVLVILTHVCFSCPRSFASMPCGMTPTACLVRIGLTSYITTWQMTRWRFGRSTSPTMAETHSQY